MKDALQDRPAVLRRVPRPAPDEKVDPVDYSPAAVLPAADQGEEPTPSDGGAAALTAAPQIADVARTSADDPVTEAPASSLPPRASSSNPERKSKLAAGSRKTARREVTFPLSTRLSQDVLELLYSAADNEGISVREAIEQAIRTRWGHN